jgi:hypothetical protein
MRLPFLAAALAGAALISACGSSSSARPAGGTTSPPAAGSIVVDTSGDPVIAAAGDISCSPDQQRRAARDRHGERCKMRQTSDLLVGRGLKAVLPLGDEQYEVGNPGDYPRQYGPTWGRVLAISRPAIGNHEYLTHGAAGYFGYFGKRAGPTSAGYYSYDIGAWHLIALNSSCSKVGGCGPESPQGQWLAADLRRHRARCTLAYWHHPRFSSGEHGDQLQTAPLWDALYAAGADVVLSGHDHDYERFVPQTPAGRPDLKGGIREFVVGTGGKNHYRFNAPQPGSVVRNSDTFGVLMLTLHPRSYDWRFVPIHGKRFTDAGRGSCH